MPAATFLIIGDGPQRVELEALARELALFDSVHFLGSRSDVPKLLNACDVVALTSHNEAAPVSILEALASGVPVVASNVGSVNEAVIDGVTGSLFPAGDVNAFSNATIELLSQNQRRRQMGAEGRRRVIEQWSLESMVRGYEQLIERVYTAKLLERFSAAQPRPSLVGFRRQSRDGSV
jgi:glycosyltransferase involved in cell wall biosynthesis